jgi:hypothetical protein
MRLPLIAIFSARIRPDQSASTRNSRDYLALVPVDLAAVAGSQKERWRVRPGAGLSTEISPGCGLTGGCQSSGWW